MRLFIVTLILISSLIQLGCQPSNTSGTTTGNPFVAFTITSSSQAATVVWNKLRNNLEKFAALFIPTTQALPPPNSIYDSSGLPITINQAWMVIENIEFKDSETNTGNDGQEIEFAGPYAINLLENNPSPIGSAQLFYSSLKRVRMTMHKLDFIASGAPAGLLNNALYITGSVNGISFELSSDEGVDFEVSGANAISPTQNSELLMTIRIANLFKKINLSSITSNTSISNANKVNASNPCPNINPSAADLYTCFKDGIKSEANFGIDYGGDHELDTNDDSVR